MELHPHILRKNGKAEFVVLPYEEYVELRELLDDVLDVVDLREAVAREGDAPLVPLDEAKRRLGIP